MSFNFDKSKPIIVTGASSYISSHIINKLIHQGYKVRGTVRDLKKKEKYEFLYSLTPDAQDKIELLEADLMDNNSWDKIFEKGEVLIHVASPHVFSDVSEKEQEEAPQKGIKAIVDAALKHGYKIPYKETTKDKIKDSDSQAANYMLHGKDAGGDFDHSRTEGLLGIELIDCRKGLVEGCQSIIEKGLIVDKISPKPHI